MLLDNVLLGFNLAADMADFQYTPNEVDPVIQLRKAMDTFDGR